MTSERSDRIAAAYLSGLTLEACAALEQVSVRTAARDLDAERIPRRHQLPRPEPRRCARVGCSETFSPTRRQVSQGMGLYCSRACSSAVHRIYECPTERHCEICGKPFTPPSDSGWQDAAGWNRFCSILCAHVAQRGRRKNARQGSWIACHNCGRELFRYNCELERERGVKEGWFCSPSCHGDHRRRYPWPGYRTFINPAASGTARQRMIGGREGRRLGGGEGRRRVPTPLPKVTLVLNLRASHPKLGERPIAERVGISRNRVREILAREGAETSPDESP